MLRSASILLLLTCLIVPTSAAEVAPKIDAKTEELVRKLTARFDSAKSAEVDLKVTVLLAGPEKTEVPATYSLSVIKPNKIALVLKDGAIGASIFSDATNATTFIPMLKRYVVQPAPKTIAELVLEAGSAFGDATGSMAFIAALFNERPYNSLIAGVSEATYSGVEIVDGSPLQRLNFKQEGIGWSLLMTTNSPPLLRRIEVDVSKLPVDAAKMTMDFKNWEFDSTIPADRFNFVPPKETQKVDAFFDSDSDLVGEKIPEFKLHSIDGVKWDSSTFKGHGSVIVFWAGEEEHCIKALTALSQLADVDKTVKFYSINLDEVSDKTKVKDLFAKKKITLPVALDPAHSSADEMEVDGVPMTFIVDKGGVIRNAFLGFHEDFKNLVAKEIGLINAPK